jgi:hypothetical protein
MISSAPNSVYRRSTVPMSFKAEQLDGVIKPRLSWPICAVVIFGPGIAAILALIWLCYR